MWGVEVIGIFRQNSIREASWVAQISLIREKARFAKTSYK